MTTYTSNYDLPYPGLGDQPNGPSQVAALANATDSALVTVSGVVQQQIVTVPESVITFNSIPQNFQEIRLRWFGKSTDASTTYRVNGLLTWNGVATAYQYLFEESTYGAAVGSIPYPLLTSATTSQTSVPFSHVINSYLSNLDYSAGEIKFPGYAQSLWHQVVSCEWQSGSFGTYGAHGRATGVNTGSPSGLTSLSVTCSSGNWAVGSTFTLLGIN